LLIVGKLGRVPLIDHVDIHVIPPRRYRHSRANGESTRVLREIALTEDRSWDRVAEITGQFLSKGQPVYVEGRLQPRH
jgi:single-stranded DNA-binding protein